MTWWRRGTAFQPVLELPQRPDRVGGCRVKNPWDRVPPVDDARACLLAPPNIGRNSKAPGRPWPAAPKECQRWREGRSRASMTGGTPAELGSSDNHNQAGVVGAVREPPLWVCTFRSEGFGKD